MPYPFGRDYTGGQDEIDEYKKRRDMQLEEDARDFDERKEGEDCNND